MLKNIICFCLVPVANLLLFWLWFSFPMQLGVWFVWAYHGTEVVVMLALLCGNTSRKVKQAVLCAFIGGVLGCFGEWWLLKQAMETMFDSVSNGLVP